MFGERNDAISPVTETPFPLLDPDALVHDRVKRSKSYDPPFLDEANYNGINQGTDLHHHQQPLAAPRPRGASFNNREMRPDELFSDKRVSQKFRKPSIVNNLAMIKDEVDLDLPERDYMGSPNFYRMAVQSGAIYDTASPVKFNSQTGVANFGHDAFGEVSSDPSATTQLHVPGESTTDNIKVFRNSLQESDADREANGLLHQQNMLMSAIEDFEDGADAAYYLKALDVVHGVDVMSSLSRHPSSSSFLMAEDRAGGSRRCSIVNDL